MENAPKETVKKKKQKNQTKNVRGNEQGKFPARMNRTTGK